MTEGFSGADVFSVVNTAVSLVLHDYIQKYPSPEEALKHTSEALVSIRHFEDAIKKVLHTVSNNTHKICGYLNRKALIFLSNLFVKNGLGFRVCLTATKAL